MNVSEIRLSTVNLTKMYRTRFFQSCLTFILTFYTFLISDLESVPRPQWFWRGRRRGGSVALLLQRGRRPLQPARTGTSSARLYLALTAPPQVLPPLLPCFARRLPAFSSPGRPVLAVAALGRMLPWPHNTDLRLSVQTSRNNFYDTKRAVSGQRKGVPLDFGVPSQILAARVGREADLLGPNLSPSHACGRGHLITLVDQDRAQASHQTLSQLPLRLLPKYRAASAKIEECWKE
mmetsp:Transcript_10090/g.20286  ORF Transcript_10090/g.20286 Transcript_10090/m.20286 type:complete len:235 (+) Transcript_10090:18-722(+)